MSANTRLGEHEATSFAPRKVREGLTVAGIGPCLILVALSIVAHVTTSDVLTWLAVAAGYPVAFFSVYRMTYSVGNYLSLFLLFHLLYGIVGPLSVILGQDFSRVFAGSVPATTPFLREQIMSLTAFICAATFVRNVYRRHRWFAPRLEFDKAAMSTSAVFLAAVSSAMYLINVVRLGGVGAVLLGKAVFQSNLGSLVLTLPDQIMADIAVAVFAIAYLAPGKSIPKSTFFAFFVCLSPVILSHALLGQRGPLVGWLLITFTAVGLYKRYRFRARHLLWALVCYTGLSALFILRGAITNIAWTRDIEGGLQTAFRQENLAYALNPATNEFGGAFGNYSAFVQEKRLPYPQLGKTYLEGLAVPIPGFMYPGEKPEQIAYVFRDTYIPDFARVTRISGTGFGSVLEAYINFGRFGSIVVYAIVGFGLALWEFSKNRLGALGVLNYVALSQLMQTFHRSSFGLVYGTVVLVLILTGTWWVIFNAARGKMAAVRAVRAKPVLLRR